MVNYIGKTFYRPVTRCLADFQLKFRKAYQHLKVVDTPLEVKGVSQIGKGLYKLVVDKSRIALRSDGNTLTVGCFLYNQFYKSTD